MNRGKFCAKVSPPTVDFLLDTGHPMLNCTLDGVLKISGVGAAHAASQEAFSLFRKGRPRKNSSQLLSNQVSPEKVTSRRDFEKIVKKAGKEGLQWGMVAGMYAGIGYGMEKIRGKHDWVTIIHVDQFLDTVVKHEERLLSVLKTSGRLSARMVMNSNSSNKIIVGAQKNKKNAALGGALTGALLSVSDSRFNQDKMIRTALTASALATASEFLKIL